MDIEKSPFEILHSLIPEDTEFVSQYPRLKYGKQLAFFSDGLSATTELCAIRDGYVAENPQGLLRCFIIASLDTSRSTVCVTTVSRETSFDYLNIDKYSADIFRKFLGITKLIQIDPSHSAFNLSTTSDLELSYLVLDVELDD